jgi:hypothetical protein
LLLQSERDYNIDLERLSGLQQNILINYCLPALLTKHYFHSFEAILVFSYLTGVRMTSAMDETRNFPFNQDQLPPFKLAR